MLLLIYNDIFYYDTTTSKRIGFNSFSNIGDDFRRLAVKTCRRSNSIIKRTDAENLTTRNVPCTCTPTISIEWHFLNYTYFQVQQLEEVLTGCTVSSVWNIPTLCPCKIGVEGGSGLATLEKDYWNRREGATLLFSNYVYWPTPRASVTSHSNGWVLRVASAD